MNPELVSFVFRPLTHSGAAARSRLGSVIALPPQLPSRIDYHLNEFCNLIAREIA